MGGDGNCDDENNRKTCGAPEYKGDGNCDDENNKASCNYDGGDCCGSSISKKYCTKCLCLDPNAPSTTTTKKPDCGDKKYKGDGQCDDNNNLKSCDWDGGDCCGVNIGTAYCSACKCLNPNYVP